MTAQQDRLGRIEARLRAVAGQLPAVQALPVWPGDAAVRVLLLVEEDVPWLIGELQRAWGACAVYQTQLRHLERRLTEAQERPSHE